MRIQKNVPLQADKRKKHAIYPKHMKRILYILPSLFCLVALHSCIQDEPLNAECDITDVDSVWLSERTNFISTYEVKNDRVVFNIKRKVKGQAVERTALNPKFCLTPGARITAIVDSAEVEANGITRNFETPQIYTVHSQDGLWHKDYSVTFAYLPLPTTEWNMSFENHELETKNQRYQTWYEMDASDATNPRRDWWSTGNPGFALCGMAKSPADYPSTVEENGVEGKCVKLVTRSTGSFGKRTSMPIAAGNLFIGTFNASVAAVSQAKALQATKFGLPIVQSRPLRLEGYYKYKAGDTFTDSKLNVLPEQHDTADIYAVVYKNKDASGKGVTLNGANVLSSDLILYMARIDKPVEFEGSIDDLAASEWIPFSEEFKPFNGEEIDLEHLEDYSIAVVMTSSRQGAYFKGAVGSTLYVDELKVVYEKVED